MKHPNLSSTAESAVIYFTAFLGGVFSIQMNGICSSRSFLGGLMDVTR